MKSSSSSSITRALLTFLKGSLAFQLSLQATFVLSLVLLSQLTVAENTDEQIHENEGIEATTPLEIENSTTQNTTSVGNSSNESSNTRAVVAASIISVLGCCAIVLGVYLFKRRRQSRNLDKEKKMQIQMSSARNAGIYQDLTVSVPDNEKPNGSPEHERLKQVEDA